MELNMGELITSNELGERLRLRPDTIKRWTREGLIPCLKLSGKVIRYDFEDVVKAIRQRSLESS
jgi:predicted site-specific integrase-resolvase